MSLCLIAMALNCFFSRSTSYRKRRWRVGTRTFNGNDNSTASHVANIDAMFGKKHLFLHFYSNRKKMFLNRFSIVLHMMNPQIAGLFHFLGCYSRGCSLRNILGFGRRSKLAGCYIALGGTARLPSVPCRNVIRVFSHLSLHLKGSGRVICLLFF